MSEIAGHGDEPSIEPDNSRRLLAVGCILGGCARIPEPPSTGSPAGERTESTGPEGGGGSAGAARSSPSGNAVRRAPSKGLVVGAAIGAQAGPIGAAVGAGTFLIYGALTGHSPVRPRQRRHGGGYGGRRHHRGAPRSRPRRADRAGSRPRRRAGGRDRSRTRAPGRAAAPDRRRGGARAAPDAGTRADRPATRSRSAGVTAGARRQPKPDSHADLSPSARTRAS